MFHFLYGLMAGDHEELPRHRRADPAITFDPVSGAFVSEDGRERGGEWLGRGEVPGLRRPDPTLENEGRTVIDEARELATRPPARR